MAKNAQSQLQRRQMMLNEPIHRLIPKMAVPTIVAFLINSIYSLADPLCHSCLLTIDLSAQSILFILCGADFRHKHTS